jgi:hypothetical protein
MGAAQFIYNQARDETTYGNYILPMTTKLQTQITSQFGEMWSAYVLSNASLSRLPSLAHHKQYISRDRLLDIQPTALLPLHW